MFKLYMVLPCIFFKPYISKKCNDFYIYIYIYIYDLEFNWLLDLLNLAPNKLLATKIKNLDRHMAEN